MLAGRFGLAVLLRQGLAAWVEQSSQIPAPVSVPPSEFSRPFPLPDDTNADVINVLAAMALGHIEEVHA